MYKILSFRRYNGRRQFGQLTALERNRDFHFLPGDLKRPQEPDASEHGEAEGWHDAVLGQDELDNTADHDETVEAVEEGNEISLKIVDESVYIMRN
jgi:hypothetical protein